MIQVIFLSNDRDLPETVEVSINVNGAPVNLEVRCGDLDKSTGDRVR